MQGSIDVAETGYYAKPYLGTYCSEDGSHFYAQIFSRLRISLISEINKQKIRKLQFIPSYPRFRFNMTNLHFQKSRGSLDFFSSLLLKVLLAAPWVWSTNLETEETNLPSCRCTASSWCCRRSPPSPPTYLHVIGFQLWPLSKGARSNPV